MFNTIAIGTLVALDLDTRLLTRLSDGESVILPASACNCLKSLAEARGELLTQEQLMDIGWRNSGVEVTENSVRVMITKIRRALATLEVQKSIMLLAVTRSGYKLVIRPTQTTTQPVEATPEAQVEPLSVAEPPSPRPHYLKRRTLACIAGMILGGAAVVIFSLFFKVTPEIITYVQWKGKNKIPQTEVWVPVNQQKETAAIQHTLQLYNDYVVSREKNAKKARYLYVTIGLTEKYRGLFTCMTPLQRSGNHCESYYFRYH